MYNKVVTGRFLVTQFVDKNKIGIGCFAAVFTAGRQSRYRCVGSESEERKRKSERLGMSDSAAALPAKIVRQTVSRRRPVNSFVLRSECFAPF